MPGIFERLKDHRIVVGLYMVLAAIFSWLQAGRETPISDWAWTTENAYRITLGQVPYVDFWIVATPGTYYVQALLMLVFGYSATVQFVFTSVCAALSVLLTYLIVIRFVPDRVQALWLCLPLILCSYVLFPYPWQDNDATLVLLFAIYMFLRCIEREFPWFHSYGVGVLLSLPFFFKQNLGGFSGLATAFILCSFLWIKPKGFSFKKWIVIVLGGVTPFLLFFGYLYVVSGEVGLRNFYFWIFVNARRMKTNKSLSQMLSIFELGGVVSHGLCVLGLWAITRWKRWSVLSFLLIPGFLFVYLKGAEKAFSRVLFRSASLSFNWLPLFILTAIFMVVSYRKNQWSTDDKWKSLIFLFAPLTCFGTFLSQGSAGSSFGVWPLFILSLAFLLRFVQSSYPKLPLNRWLAIYCISLVVVLAGYNYDNGRFYFIGRYRSLPQQGSKHPRLKGLACPGPFLAELDEVYSYVEKRVPKDDLIIAFPGEDPFYFATGRKPILPYSYQCSRAIPFPTSWRLERALEKNLQWVLLKMEPQMRVYFDKPDKKTEELLAKHFIVDAQFRNYTLYKRR